jgi:predicted lysophospholipase L1 biosynthesis ABC-type transport system permease subunit
MSGSGSRLSIQVGETKSIQFGLPLQAQVASRRAIHRRGLPIRFVIILGQACLRQVPKQPGIGLTSAKVFG